MKITKGMNIHFIGIGGVGMSAAAYLSLERGVKVTGCDLQSNRYTQGLRGKGCTIWYDHHESHVKDADLVVVSSAVAPDNPEIIFAKKWKVPVYKRALYTLMLMKEKKLIGISGSHGKTTTTWMIAHIFINADMEPNLMVGGTVPDIYGNFRIGKGEWFISEVDESDGTLKEIYPHVAVITNIDREHINYYKSLKRIQDAFKAFCTNTDKNGAVVVCGDDRSCMEMVKGMKRKVITYGFSNTSDIMASRIQFKGLHTVFNVRYKNSDYHDIRLQFCGKHNILNCLAAFGAAASQGLPEETILKGIETCRPVARRFELAGAMDDIMVVNDYAHHPAEIQSVMKAADNHLKHFRKIYVFQPHRYTRLRDCWDDFILILNKIEILIVLPVYSANEQPLEGYTSQRLVEALLKKGVKAEFMKKNLVVKHLETIVKKGDCVLFLGAGDIGEMYHEFAERITK